MSSDSTKHTFTFTFKLVYLVWALLGLWVATIFMFVWGPLGSGVDMDRVISVVGETVIEAEPDKFVFNPYWQLEGKNKTDAIEKAVAKANVVVKKLKALGVPNKDIKLDSSSYNNWWYNAESKTDMATVNLTVDVTDTELAQDVQDYLLTTKSDGQITPWPTFSKDKQDKLEIQAREEAIADARAKAEQSATELGEKVGKVISINENTGFGDYPVAYAEASVDSAGSGRDEVKSLPIQPGENEYNYSITVVFAIK